VLEDEPQEMCLGSVERNRDDLSQARAATTVYEFGAAARACCRTSYFSRVADEATTGASVDAESCTFGHRAAAVGPFSQGTWR